MKEIKLTRGLTAQVDDDMFEELSKYHWNAGKKKHTYYASRKFGRSTISMHKVIMGTVGKKGVIVDHKDMNGLNNQKSNLRLCTFSQNLVNSNKRCDSIGKYKGVTWQQKKGRKTGAWVARIGNPAIYLGRYATAEEAALAYDYAVYAKYGEFAKLNDVKTCMILSAPTGATSGLPSRA